MAAAIQASLQQSQAERYLQNYQAGVEMGDTPTEEQRLLKCMYESKDLCFVINATHQYRTPIYYWFTVDAPNVDCVNRPTFVFKTAHYSIKTNTNTLLLQYVFNHNQSFCSQLVLLIAVFEEVENPPEETSTDQVTVIPKAPTIVQVSVERKIIAMRKSMLNHIALTTVDFLHIFATSPFVCDNM